MTIFKGQVRLNDHCKERVKRASSEEVEGENIKEGIRIIQTAVLLKIRCTKKILKATD